MPCAWCVEDFNGWDRTPVPASAPSTYLCDRHTAEHHNEEQ
jgi:hypothetical protein